MLFGSEPRYDSFYALFEQAGSNVEEAHSDDAPWCRRASDQGVTAPGGWISRLRILPVAPLGSCSTNQIWRGYL